MFGGDTDTRSFSLSATIILSVLCQNPPSPCHTIKCEIPFLPQRSHVEVHIKFQLYSDTIRSDFQQSSNVIIYTKTTLYDPASQTQFKLKDSTKSKDIGNKITITDKIVIDNTSSNKASSDTKIIYLVVAIIVGFLAWIIFWFLCGKNLFKSKPKQQKVYTVNDLEAKNTGDRRKLKREASQYQQDRKTGDGADESAVLISGENKSDRNK